MKSKFSKVIIIAIVVAGMCGCVAKRGFDRGAIGSNLRETAPSISDQDIKEAYELKPQISFPFKLALYFNGSGWNSKWTGEDKEYLLSIEKQLANENIVSKLILITPSDVENPGRECGYGCNINLKSIRLAAARYGADAVLVINGISDTDRYNNILGVTYVLLVPMTFIPGTELDALFMTNCKMWDVRNQYLYFSAEAEGEANQIRATMFIEEKHAIEKAKKNALAKLKDEIVTRLKNIAAKQ